MGYKSILLFSCFSIVVLFSCIIRQESPTSKKYAVSDGKLVLVTSPFIVDEIHSYLVGVVYHYSTVKTKYLRLFVCKKTAILTKKMLTNKKYCRPALLTDAYTGSFWHSFKQLVRVEEKGKQEIVFKKFACGIFSQRIFRVLGSLCSREVAGFLPTPISSVSTHAPDVRKKIKMGLTLYDDLEEDTQDFGHERFVSYVDYYLLVARKIEVSKNRGERLQSFDDLLHARREAVSFIEHVASIRAMEMIVNIAKKLQSLSNNERKKRLVDLEKTVASYSSSQLEFLKIKKDYDAIPNETYFVMGAVFNEKRIAAENTERRYIQALVKGVPARAMSAVTVMFRSENVEATLAEIETEFNKLKLQLEEKERNASTLNKLRNSKLDTEDRNLGVPEEVRKKNAELQIFSSLTNSFNETSKTRDIAKILFNDHSLTDGTRVADVAAIVKKLAKITASYYNEDALALADE